MRVTKSAASWMALASVCVPLAMEKTTSSNRSARVVSAAYAGEHRMPGDEMGVVGHVAVADGDGRLDKRDDAEDQAAGLDVLGDLPIELVQFGQRNRGDDQVRVFAGSV